MKLNKVAGIIKLADIKNMRAIFGIAFPFLITLIPIIYFVIYGAKRLRFGQGLTYLQTSGIALIIGLITPLIAVVTSVSILSMFDQGTDNNRCYTFVTGFIAMGIGVEVFVIPVLTLIFILRAKENRNIS